MEICFNTHSFIEGLNDKIVKKDGESVEGGKSNNKKANKHGERRSGVPSSSTESSTQN